MATPSGPREPQSSSASSKMKQAKSESSSLRDPQISQLILASLPGGKMEEGDEDERETALREAHEEIGLDPSLVDVVAVLEPFLSKHLLIVFPVIGIVTNRKAFTPVANNSEVEIVFNAPLEKFHKDENWKSEKRVRVGNAFLIHYFDFETADNKFVICGFTARILIRAASVICWRPPLFVEGKRKFKVPNFDTKNVS